MSHQKKFWLKPVHHDSLTLLYPQDAVQRAWQLKITLQIILSLCQKPGI
jgi:hypothetical protein